jgi:hypothetical protein
MMEFLFMRENANHGLLLDAFPMRLSCQRSSEQGCASTLVPAPPLWRKKKTVKRNLVFSQVLLARPNP